MTRDQPPPAASSLKHEQGRQNAGEGAERETKDENIEFADPCDLLAKPGYTMRQKGSHHSFTKMDSADFFNLQPSGRKAKGYQVRQIRAILQNK